MEQATRAYIIRILALHALLLAVVAAVTAVGAQKVYYRLTEQARAEAEERQRLVARSAAGGLEAYFEGVVDNLNLLRRLGMAAADGSELAPGTGPPPTPPADAPGRRRPGGPAGDVERNVTFGTAPLLWAQLDDRTAGLVVRDTRANRIIRSFAAPGDAQAVREVARQNRAGPADPTATTVSPPLPLGSDSRRVALLTVPAGESGRYHLISVIELAEIRRRFLRQLSPDDTVPPLLLDGRGTIISADSAAMRDRPLVDMTDADVGVQVREAIETRTPMTVAHDDPLNLGGEAQADALLTLQPVRVADETWFIAVTQDLKAVSGVVDETYRGAFFWAAFVIVAAGGVLVSTAVTAIRGRGRLERLRNEMVERELKVLDDELDQARKIQLNWLPKPHCEFGGTKVAAVNTPASHISGDFYDFFELDDGRVALTIGDVTGHGMAAAFLMATTQLLVRTALQRTGDPGRVMRYVNRELARQVFGGQFVTLLVAVLDNDRRTIEMACAGHHPPLMLADGQYSPLAVDSGLVLGVDEDVAYACVSHELPEEARALLFYTDGVTEAADAAGRRYSMDQLAADLPKAVDTAEDLAQAAVDAADRFAGSREHEDDLTLVAVLLADPEPTPEPADPDHARRLEAAAVA